MAGTIRGRAPSLCERSERTALATLECDSPRRITVMRLCREVTREYQADSSSKRPAGSASLDSPPKNKETTVE